MIQKKRAYIEYLGAIENKRELSGFWQTRESAVLQTDTRGNKETTSSLKKKKQLVNLSNWENICTIPEITHFQERFERLSLSLAPPIDEVLSLYEASL